MSWRFCLILFIGVLLEWKLTLSAPAEIGKTKEKGRAYEFGFSIEEQQHRHEKRDENGIVMGEFGFITADGIYHVTVYATDENGKFKIISMKNYPYGNPEKKIMFATLPPTKKPVVTPTTGVKAMMPDGKSCGGCVLPKKMNLQPADVKGKKPDNEKQPIFRPLSKDLDANGKTNGEATKKGKSTPTKQSEPSSSTANTGKGSSASKQPLPQIDDDESDFKINVRFDDDTSSKLEPTIPAKNGNKYQLKNFLTQTTRTPTRLFTHISDTNTPKINTQFEGFSNQKNQITPSTESSLPTKQSTSFTNLNRQPTPNKNKNIKTSNILASTNNPDITPQTLGNSISKTTPNITKFINSEFPNEDSRILASTRRKLSSKPPSIVSDFSVKPIASTGFGHSRQEKPVTEISQAHGRSPPAVTTTRPKPSPTFKKSRTMYNKESLTTRNPTKSTGHSNYNTHTTQKHFPSSLKKTKPTPLPSQLSRNDKKTSIINKSPPKINNRFGFLSEEDQLPLTNEKSLSEEVESLRTTKFPNPQLSSSIPRLIPTVYNTKTKSQSSFVSSPSNPITSFKIPAINRKTTQSQEQGSTKSFAQNSGKPILKTTKEPKTFKTLSKILPDSDSGSTQSEIPGSQLSPQTSTTLKSVPKNTNLQKTGQTSPSLVTAKPQVIGKNTQNTQPLLKTSTPTTRLQQNTNGAKTSTTNTQSTNKQSSPSSQATTGKTTPSNTGGGSNNSKVGGGGGPLYRFNYILDYNSHREEGRIDGSKEGKYNTLHEDGIRRIIDYIANENGYQPHIKLERLPPNDLPTGENKLKEYEFVWFN